MKKFKITSIAPTANSLPIPEGTTVTTTVVPILKVISSSHGSAVIHKGVSCDGCGQNPLIGTRFHCTICTAPPGFDLCETCESNGTTSHPIQHFLLKMRVSYVPAAGELGLCPCQHSSKLSSSPTSTSSSDIPQVRPRQTARGGPASLRTRKRCRSNEFSSNDGSDNDSNGSEGPSIRHTTSKNSSTAATTSSKLSYQVISINGYEPDGFHSHCEKDHQAHGVYDNKKEANKHAKYVFFFKNPWGLSKEEIQDSMESEVEYSEHTNGCSKWTVLGGEGEEWTVKVNLHQTSSSSYGAKSQTKR